jgi:hypothetical protein
VTGVGRCVIPICLVCAVTLAWLVSAIESDLPMISWELRER